MAADGTVATWRIAWGIPTSSASPRCLRGVRWPPPQQPKSSEDNLSLPPPRSCTVMAGASRLLKCHAIKQVHDDGAETPCQVDILEKLPGGAIAISRAELKEPAQGGSTSSAQTGAVVAGRDERSWHMRSEVVSHGGLLGPPPINLAVHLAPGIHLAATAGGAGVIQLWAGVGPWTPIAPPQSRAWTSGQQVWLPAGIFSASAQNLPVSGGDVSFLPLPLPGRGPCCTGQACSSPANIVLCHVAGGKAFIFSTRLPESGRGTWHKVYEQGSTQLQAANAHLEGNQSIPWCHLVTLEAPVNSQGVDRVVGVEAAGGIFVVGREKRGDSLLTWQVKPLADGSSSGGNDVSASFIASLQAPDGDAFTSLQACWLPDSGGKRPEAPRCQFVTGHKSGKVRLWRLSEPVSDRDGLKAMSGLPTWQCVGCLPMLQTAVMHVLATPGSGRIIAGGAKGSAAGDAAGMSSSQIAIWVVAEAGSGLVRQEAAIALLGGAQVSAMDWLEPGNGRPLLAVGCGNSIFVFGQRDQTKTTAAASPAAAPTMGVFNSHASSCPGLMRSAEMSNMAAGADGVGDDTSTELLQGLVVDGRDWALAGSASCQGAVTGLKWMPRGILLVTCGSQLVTFGPWLGTGGTSDTGTEHQEQVATAGLSRLVEGGRIPGAQMPLYHPLGVLYLICTGSKARARAILRHLIKHGPPEGTNTWRAPVPPIQLADLPFQGDEKGLGDGETFDQVAAPRPPVKAPPTLKNFVSFSFSDSDEDEGDSNASNTWASNGGPGPVRSSSNLADSAGNAAARSLPPFRSTEAADISRMLLLPGSGPALGLSSDNCQLLRAVAAELAQSDGEATGGMQALSLDAPAKRFCASLAINSFIRNELELEAKKKADEDEAAAEAREGRAEGMSKRGGRQTIPTPPTKQGPPAPHLSSKEFAFVQLSDFCEAVLDASLPEGATWQALRDLGAGYWLTDPAVLKRKMEKIARSQYLERRDAKDAALLYLALDRRAVLLGLLKLSRDERDKKLLDFLGRDFTDQKQREAALKNAYVLLGQHRFELGAAFFVLGGDPSSAARVCVRNLEDRQLALVICRLVDGPEKKIERSLIKETLLPAVQREGDTWLASTLQLLMGDPVEAMKELLPPYHLPPGSSPGARPPAGNDPEVGAFCRLLAEKVRKGPRGQGDSAELARQLAVRGSDVAAREFERAGMPLQALEELQLADSPAATLYSGAQMVSSSKVSRNSEGEISNCQVTEDRELPEADKMNANRQGSECWVSPDLTAAATASWRLRLLSQLLSPALDQASLASSGALAEQATIVQETGRGEPLATDDNNSASAVDRKYLEQDEGIVRSCQLAAATWHFSEEDICETLSRYALHHCRPHILATVIPQIFSKSTRKSTARSSVTNWGWKLEGPEGSKGEGGLPPGAGVGKAELVALLREGPAEIARMALSCTVLSLADPLLPSGSDSSADGSAAQSAHVRWARQAALTAEQELLNYAEEVERLALAMKPLGSDETGGETGEPDWSQGPQLTILTARLAAALLGRRPRTLLHLLRPLGLGSGTALDNQADVATSAEAGQSIVLSEDATWHVLATATWQMLSSHLSESGAHMSAPAELQGHGEQQVPLPSTGDSRLSTLAGAVKSLQSAAQATWPLPANCEEMVPSAASGASKLAVTELWRAIQARHLASQELQVVVSKTTELPWYDTKSSGEGRERAHLEGGGQQLMIKAKEVVDVFKVQGELLEAVCMNQADPVEGVVGTNRKGLMSLNLAAVLAGVSGQEKAIFRADPDWPRDGWAGTVATPVAVIPTPQRHGHRGALNSPTPSTPKKRVASPPGSLGKEGNFGTMGLGIPGYGAIGAWGLGWDDWPEEDEIVDPPATMANCNSRALASHPFRPIFLAGSNNTHVYLWEFGKTCATATYGVLPAAASSLPSLLASVTAVTFEATGHRFATAGADGSASSWHLEVGGRSNVRAADTRKCFGGPASDIAFVGGSGSLLALAGTTPSGENVMLWDTLAPPASSRAAVACHEGGARVVAVLGGQGGSQSPLLVTGGKSGDIAVHDFRVLASGGRGRKPHPAHKGGGHVEESGAPRGAIWHMPNAHSGAVSALVALPGTSLFATGGKDGDVKLWDAATCSLLHTWHHVHERRIFLNARGFAAVLQAAVTSIQPTPRGLLTCGADGMIRHLACSA